MAGRVPAIASSAGTHAAARLARSLSRRFGAVPKNGVVQAVDRVDLAVARDEVVGLVGEAGCGKSTIGRMVAGIVPPSQGQVLSKGRYIATLSPEQARGEKLNGGRGEFNVR